MGGGGGKGNEAGEDLADIAKQFFGETTPLRQEMIDQFMEALTTGGVGARIPIINKALESSRRAESQTMQGTEENLARTNLAGTPFGAMVRSSTEQQGNLATSQIPTNIIAGMLQQIPGFITGTNQVVTSGMGQAAGAEAGSQNAFANLIGAYLAPFNFGFPTGGVVCDRRLKKNIKRIGSFNGVPLYEFEYLWDSIKRIGPMAQDLLKIKPEAVMMSPDGYYRVNLAALI